MTETILAFDTATEAVALGLARMDGPTIEHLASLSTRAPRRANSILLEMVVSTLEHAGVGLGDVTAIVVGRGPGSFTGVRIGVAAAKGLAQGLGISLYGVSTTEAVAWECAFAGYDGLVGVVGDAMRGEVYPALFHVANGAVDRLTPDRVDAPHAAAAEWATSAEGEVLLTGNGLAKYAAVFSEALGERARIADEEMWHPAGRGLVSAWAAARARGELGSGDPGAVLPVYTRLSDAEENERTRAGACGATPDNGVAGAPTAGGERA